MPIAVRCPHCDWTGSVKDERAGRKGKCPTCGEVFPIPRASARGRDADAGVIEDADIVDESNDEPRPRPKRRSFRDDDDRPRRRNFDAEDDDRPRPARRRRRYDEDDEDDDRPRRSRRYADDEEPRRPRRRNSSGGVNTQMVAGGVIMLLVMIVWWVVGLAFGFCFYYPPIGAVLAIVAIVRGLMGKSE